MAILTLTFPPTFDDPRQALEWVLAQLTTIETAFNQGLDGIQLNILYVEPEKKRNGLIVLASGTVDDASHWDPGGDGNPGIFAYYNGGWNKLG
jgi:hypothetical protein